MNEQKPIPLILVVDDDPHLLNLLDLRLAEQKFNVMLASSAREALKKVEDRQPDIVIADIMMPGMDGYELCKHVRANEKLHNTPFIFLSALADTQDKVKGLRLGADDYLTKPFEFHELLARIEILLDRYSRYQETFEADTEVATQGKIEDLGVIDLLQMLSFGQKTGEVHLESDEEKGFLYLMTGKLIAATYGNKHGKAALPTLLSWTHGKFTVRLTESLSVIPTIEHQTDEAIFEALRELDEVERIKQELDEKSIPVFSTKPAPDTDLHKILLQLVDGDRNLGEILLASPFSGFETAKGIKKLMAEGHISLGSVGTPPLPGEAPETPDETPGTTLSEATQEWEPLMPGEVKADDEAAIEKTEVRKDEAPKEEPRAPTEIKTPAPQPKPQEFNLIVIGTDRDSRNTFIHALSGEEEAEDKREKVLNFGRIIVAGHQLNLYGLPGAKRFAPLWQTFIHRVHGMILLADADIDEETENLRFASSLLGPRISGPKIVINTNPTHPDMDFDSETHGVEIITCLPADRPKAKEITNRLLSQLLR